MCLNLLAIKDIKIKIKNKFSFIKYEVLKNRMFDACEAAVTWAHLYGCYYEYDYEYDQVYYLGEAKYFRN